MRLWQLNVVGSLVHFVLFRALINLYFTSPLVHVEERFSARMEPPASRVVLLSIDGLRADKLFGFDHRGNPRAPYLRSVVENRGTWGLSHTSVPTGSRHGHAALIAGYYKNALSFTKGWGEGVDSTFNQSRYTLSWSCPKVVNQFYGDPSRSHVEINSPPPGLQTIASPEQADKWALDSVTSLFESAKKNDTLMRKLKQNRVIFFLHLMGMDTTSHTHKPHSEIYARHVRKVDDIILEVTTLVNHFYDDTRTTFIVTSDHGMTEWGVHVAGDPHETQTPLITWGPGIRKPRATNSTCGDFSDNLCRDWRLQHRARTDVRQVDVAALISYLLNIPFPANNMGVVPLDLLSGTERDKAEGMVANAKQIVAQYQVKTKEVEDRTSQIFFSEFQGLKSSDQEYLMMRVWNLMRQERYNEAITETRSLIDRALKGLHYYQAYNRRFMRSVLALLFLGWIGHVIHELLASQGTPAPQFSVGIFCYFAGVAFLLMLWLYLNGLPSVFYVYCAVAVFLWMKLFNWSRPMLSAVKQSQIRPLFFFITFCAICLECVVVCFFCLPFISAGLVAMAAWPFTTPLWRVDRRCCARWAVSCVLIAVFPALPVAKGHSQYCLVLLAGLVAFLFGMCWLWRLLDLHETVDILPKTVMCVQLGLVAVATVVVKVATDRIAAKADLLPVTQWTSWFILVSSPVFPMLTGASLEVRLFSVGLAFTAPYLLLCYTYDGLVFLALIFHLHCWLRLETALSACYSDSDSDSGGHLLQVTANGVGVGVSSQSGPCCGIAGPRNDAVFQPTLVTPGDVRRAFFCILLVIAAYFGADNVASLNTHDLALNFCFFTVFIPPGSTSLILIKSAIPILLVTCTLRAVLSKVRGSVRSGQLVIVLLMDFIALNFFFLVNDDGSLHEIGDCISHFAIAVLMIIITLWVPGLAHLFVPLAEPSK